MTENQPAAQDAGTPLPELLALAVDGAREKKAENLVVLDLRQSDGFTDYFVICSGRSTKQVKAIAEAIETHLRLGGIRPSHIEGYPAAEWVLLDYFECVVHVFTPETRKFYSLERLWGKAVRLDL
jgi:ribosome-associated protein